MARVFFISDAGPAAAPLVAALDADPALQVVARVADPIRAAALIGERRPEVVLFQQTAADRAGRVAVEAAAAASGAAILLAGAGVDPLGDYHALRLRLRAMAAPRASEPPAAGAAGKAPLKWNGRGIRLIAIGASTGGVEALVTVLSRFPADTPPVVIVQHMPQHFTASFAARLDTLCAARVEEATDGAPLENGRMYLAPGGPAHMEVDWLPNRRVRLVHSDPVNRHRPSVDVTFNSIARAQIPGVVAALLTGMGRDGAEGLRAIKDAGGRTIAQDRDSSTVYGMPRAALELGAVDHGTPLNEIADAIFALERNSKEAV